ncbi:MAG: RluA family pseudouridine synthase [Planctomycetes bacterium]|nr:RluA family pseudouridine synthase [Planctomycetota bacterium]
MRLDLHLARERGLSRRRAKQLIDEGRVFIGPRRIVIASWEVRPGDRVTLRDPHEAPLPRARRYLEVVHEDEHVLVVEKPAGVACERSAQTVASTLVDDIRDYLARSHRTGGRFPSAPRYGRPADAPPAAAETPYLGLLHRLDRETSGLMVYALSPEAEAGLKEQFKRHAIDRRYLAWVEGNVKRASGRLDWPIVKDTAAGGRRMKALQAGGGGAGRPQPEPRGSHAVTHYEVKRRLPGRTLVEARLETGRTHQVRVHFAALGHPVVGDKTYGSRVPAPRQALHAWMLGFAHPVTGKRLAFRSEPPGDFWRAV